MSKFIWPFLFIVVFPAAAFGEQSQSPVSEGPPTAPQRVVAARVGDSEITAQDLVQFAAVNPQRVRALADGPEGKAQVLRLLIANVLLQQSMAKLDLLPPEPDSKDYQDAYEKLAAMKFPRPETIDDGELRAFFDERKESFGIPASLRISQIQTRYPNGADAPEKDAAKRRAEAALSRVKAGEDFGAVAAEVTENAPAKLESGDLGFLDRNTFSPWLTAALDGIEVG
ncbi:MAG: peptidylprolyl isomerase, partial [Thiohalocapsa sp.]